MKTQQRSFVVEIKSSRRQMKTQPKSIWGNTDFKALARDAEASLPFMHNAKLETSPHPGDLPAERELAAYPVIDSADIAPSVVPLIEADDIQPSRQKAGPISFEPVTAVNKRPKHRSKTVPTRREAAKRVVEGGSEVRPISVAGEISSDDLTLLLADNRRLKLLLVEHLRRENARLEQMLKRFATD